MRRKTAPMPTGCSSMTNIAIHGLGIVLLTALVWQASGLWADVACLVGRWLDEGAPRRS